MKKIIASAPLRVLFCTARAYKGQLSRATEYKVQTNIELTQRQLITYQDASSVAKKTTEDIFHKIYTEKGAVTGSEKRAYMFPSANRLADARKEVASYMGAQ